MPAPPKKMVENVGKTAKSDEPDRLRPYIFHRIELKISGSSALAECPFCGKPKWYVSVDTGQWQCKVCGEEGNAITFLRKLWDVSDAHTNGQSNILAAERGFLDPMTVTAWGVCQSIIDRCWMVPGYDTHGKLVQLYRRTRTVGGVVLLPTPGVWPDGKVHALHMPSLQFDPTRSEIHVCEGPWDGMAYWEVARQAKRGESGLELTGSAASSILADINVVAVPGCNVFQQDWLSLCRGKVVTLLYDSDRPIINKETGVPYQPIRRPGYDGMRRVAKMLAGVAAEVRYLKWSDQGYDPALPSGYDVRDWLKGVAN